MSGFRCQRHPQRHHVVTVMVSQWTVSLTLHSTFYSHKSLGNYSTRVLLCPWTIYEKLKNLSHVLFLPHLFATKINIHPLNNSSIVIFGDILGMALLYYLCPQDRVWLFNLVKFWIKCWYVNECHIFINYHMCCKIYLFILLFFLMTFSLRCFPLRSFPPQDVIRLVWEPQLITKRRVMLDQSAWVELCSVVYPWQIVLPIYLSQHLFHFLNQNGP